MSTSVKIDQTSLITALAQSPLIISALVEPFDDLLAIYLNEIDESALYNQVWDSLPADAREDLHKYAARLNGLVTHAFVAGLLCAHAEVVGG